MRSPRRMGVALAVAAALLSAGCAAGQHAETAEEHPTLDGTTATVGHMALRAIAILPPSSTSYAPGSSPQLRLVLVNTGRDPDQLTSISSPDASGWGAFATASAAAAAANPNPLKTAPSGTKPITIGAGSKQSFGVPDSTATLLLLNIKKQLYPASTVPITFTFANAGSVTAPVPVQLSVNPPASYLSPPPAPEPNPTA